MHCIAKQWNTRKEQPQQPTPCRLTVSLHLSSPPCREVVCSLGAPSSPWPPPSPPSLCLPPFLLLPPLPSPTFFPHTQPKPHPDPALTLPPRVPSISTGRWLDGTSYLHATPHPLADYQPASGNMPPLAGEWKLTGTDSLGAVTKERTCISQSAKKKKKKTLQKVLATFPLAMSWAEDGKIQFELQVLGTKMKIRLPEPCSPSRFESVSSSPSSTGTLNLWGKKMWTSQHGRKESSCLVAWECCWWKILSLAKTQPPCCSFPCIKVQLVRSSLTPPCVTAPTASRLLGSYSYSRHAKGGGQLVLLFTFIFVIWVKQAGVSHLCA